MKHTSVHTPSHTHTHTHTHTHAHRASLYWPQTHPHLMWMDSVAAVDYVPLNYA